MKPIGDLQLSHEREIGTMLWESTWQRRMCVYWFELHRTRVTGAYGVQGKDIIGLLLLCIDIGW